MARSVDAPVRKMVTQMKPEIPAAASPVKTKSRTGCRVLTPPGLRIKQLVLGIGAVYFTFVAVTNMVNFIVSVGGYHWSFLNSGNVSYIASITKVYSWPAWFDKAAVLAAALVEAAGALLFWKALRNFRGHGTGARDAWIALGWNIMVWLGFIAGTEFFVAYQSEAPFRELLAISLLMAIVIAVVPDEAGLPDGQPQGPGTPTDHAADTHGDAEDIAGRDHGTPSSGPAQPAREECERRPQIDRAEIPGSGAPGHRGCVLIEMPDPLPRE